MSYALSSFVDCPNLQERLDNLFGCDYTKTLKNNEVSLVKFLHSPANTNGIIQNQLSPGSGKLRRVEVVYTPRIPKGAVSTTITPSDCESTDKFGDRVETYDIDPNQGVQIDRKIDPEDLIRRCEQDSQYVERMLLSMMEANIRRLDEIYANQIIAFAGKFGLNESNVTNNTKTVRTRTNSVDNRLVSNWISDVEFASENAGYCAAPVVFAWDDVYKVAQELRASNCCNDNGLNLAVLENLSGMMFVPNRNIPSALGSNSRFLTLDAGKVLPVSFLRYATGDNLKRIENPISLRTTINHPGTGLDFDLKMEYSCSVWNVFVSLATKLVAAPDDMYEVEDIYSGVTGVNKYVVNNS